MTSLDELLEDTKLMLKDLEQVMRGKPVDKALLEQKAVLLFEHTSCIPEQSGESNPVVEALVHQAVQLHNRVRSIDTIRHIGVLKSLLRGVCANVLAKLAVRNYRTAITCIKLYAKAGLELRQAVIDHPSAEHCLQQALVFWEQGDRDTLSQLMPEPDFQELCTLVYQSRMQLAGVGRPTPASQAPQVVAHLSQASMMLVDIPCARKQFVNYTFEAAHELARHGAHSEAIACYELCLAALSPLHATIDQDVHAEAEAEAELQRLEVTSHLAMALCLKELNHYDAALEQLNRLRQGGSNSTVRCAEQPDIMTTILYAEYSIHSQAGRLPEAVDCVKQLIQLPNSTTPALQCIHALASSNATSGAAMALFEYAVEHLPSHADRITVAVEHVQVMLSRCHQLPDTETMELHNAAIELAERILQTLSNNTVATGSDPPVEVQQQQQQQQQLANTLTSSAASYRADSLWQRSIDCCRVLTRLPSLASEQLSRALGWQSDALLHLHEHDEALATIQHAFKLQPSCCNAAILCRQQMNQEERQVSAHLLGLLRVSTVEPLADAPVLSTAEQLDRLLCCGVTAAHEKAHGAAVRLFQAWLTEYCNKRFWQQMAPEDDQAEPDGLPFTLLAVLRELCNAFQQTQVAADLAFENEVLPFLRQLLAVLSSGQGAELRVLGTAADLAWVANFSWNVSVARFRACHELLQQLRAGEAAEVPNFAKRLVDVVVLSDTVSSLYQHVEACEPETRANCACLMASSVLDLLDFERTLPTISPVGQLGRTQFDTEGLRWAERALQALKGLDPIVDSCKLELRSLVLLTSFSLHNLTNQLPHDFLEQKQPGFLLMDPEALTQCVDLACREATTPPTVTIGLLQLGIQRLLQEPAPNYDLLGRFYQRLIWRARTQQEAAQFIDEFTQLASGSSAFEAPRVDEICGKAYNWALNLLELKQRAAALCFVEKAMRLLPHTSASFSCWAQKVQELYQHIQSLAPTATNAHSISSDVHEWFVSQQRSFHGL